MQSCRSHLISGPLLSLLRKPSAALTWWNIETNVGIFVLDFRESLTLGEFSPVWGPWLCFPVGLETFEPFRCMVVNVVNLTGLESPTRKASRYSCEDY